MTPKPGSECTGCLVRCARDVAIRIRDASLDLSNRLRESEQGVQYRRRHRSIRNIKIATDVADFHLLAAGM